MLIELHLGGEEGGLGGGTFQSLGVHGADATAAGALRFPALTPPGGDAQQVT